MLPSEIHPTQFHAESQYELDTLRLHDPASVKAADGPAQIWEQATHLQRLANMDTQNDTHPQPKPGVREVFK
ncbi:MAG: hypothetical protein RLY72_1623 [Planctomycetota bacterium]|jgi:hypothetical protein